MAGEGTEPGTGILLAKLRATPQLSLARTELAPLRADVPGGARGFAFDGSPQWFKVMAEPSASSWDQAHARVAAQLGIDERDVLFVEPNLVQTLYLDDTPQDPAAGLLGAAATRSWCYSQNPSAWWASSRSS